MVREASVWWSQGWQQANWHRYQSDLSPLLPCKKETGWGKLHPSLHFCPCHTPLVMVFKMLPLVRGNYYNCAYSWVSKMWILTQKMTWQVPWNSHKELWGRGRPRSDRQLCTPCGSEGWRPVTFQTKGKGCTTGSKEDFEAQAKPFLIVYLWTHFCYFEGLGSRQR